MERQSYYQPSESGNKESSKDKKTSGGFNVVPNPAFPSVERPAEQPQQAERRHIPIAPAFEGVISWREKADEMIRHGEELHRQQEAKENAELRVEGEQSKDKDSKEKDSSKKDQTLQQPIPFRPPQEVPTPRPLGEVIADEVEAQKDIREAEEGQSVAAADYQPAVPFRVPEFSQEQHDQREDTNHPAPVSAPAFGAFPSLADRAPETTQVYQESHEAAPQEAYQPPTPMQPGEYQAYVAAETEGQPNAAEAAEDPNQSQYGYAAQQPPAPQPAFNQAPPAGQAFNPNANPFMQPTPGVQPNLPPTNPNLTPVAGGGNMGGNGNLPPNQPGYGFNNSPYNPNSPYHPAFTGGGPAANQAPAPVMPIERPGLPQTNRDPRVGGVAALLGLEYFARKRADRKLEKRVNQRSDERFKKHEQQMAMDHRRLQEQQQEFAAEQQRQTRDLNRMRYQENAPQSVTDALRSTNNLPKPFESAPNMFTAPEQGASRPMGPEVRQQPKPAAEAAVKQAAQEAEEQQAIHVGQNEHVAHSAWHNIVVDEKGHEVVGAIQYGEGFQRERQQESIRDNFAMSDSGQAGAGSSSQITGGGYAQDQFGSPMLPSGMTNPTLPQGQSTHIDPQHQLPATNKQQSNITNPWFWIMLILIVAAFFTAALV
jgi:hypothetical protein